MRNENLVLRMSPQEKRQTVLAAEQAGVTVTEYSRKAIIERAQIEAVADRLLIAILSAIEEHTHKTLDGLRSVNERIGTTASKDDLRKRAEWIASRLPAEGRQP